MLLLAKERYGVHGCRIAADCAPAESAGALEAVSFSHQEVKGVAMVPCMVK